MEYGRVYQRDKNKQKQKKYMQSLHPVAVLYTCYHY